MNHTGDWNEIAHLKTSCPRILCIVPSVAQDIVASALTAIGARPIFPEDPQDVTSFLLSDLPSPGVLVDTAARLELIDSLHTAGVEELKTLVVCVSKTGTCKTRRQAAVRLIRGFRTSALYGSEADIVAVSKSVCGTSESDDKEQDAKVERKARSQSTTPNSQASTLSLPGRYRSRSPSPARLNQSDQRAICRSPTPKLAQVQYREGSRVTMDTIEMMGFVRRLAARAGSSVFTHELGIVSNGEEEVEIGNQTVGMDSLHSMCQVGSAIVCAVCAVSEVRGQKVSPVEVGHAGALFFAAFEQSAMAKSGPGDLRCLLLNKLFEMNEPTLKDIAKLKITAV